MSSTYRPVPLGELCHVTIGRQRSPKDHHGEHMVQYLRAANVKDGRLDLSSVMAMNFDPAEQASYTLRRGDVLVTEGCGSPAELGASARWQDDLPGTVCFQNTLLRLRAIPGVSDAGYLYHVARWCQSSGAWLTASSGTSILHIGHTRAKKVPVPAPSVDIQRKIAAILSAYDDLIENNNRRVKLVADMAQRIYREWFVDLRYPGHEKVPLVNSELGPVPQGWEVARLGAVAENFDRQRKPLSGMVRALRPGLYPYYGAAKIFDYIDDYIFDGTYLLMAEDGSVITPDGKPLLQYVTGKFWANNHTHVLRGTRVSTEFLSLLLADTPISGYITGAAQPKITQANMNRIPCVVPASMVAAAFDDIAVPIFRSLTVLASQATNLRASRDLLVPRLISGDVNVTDLNIATAEDAA